MSVGLAWTSAAKRNEKLVNQKYAKLFRGVDSILNPGVGAGSSVTGIICPHG